MGDEVDSAANQLAEVLSTVGDPFDIAVPGDEAIEVQAIAFTKQQAAAVVAEVFKPFELHRVLAVEEHRDLFTQHRYRREAHALFALRRAVGQDHVDPAFGGVQQAALPVAQHDDLDLVPQVAK
ncbi:hypothetical protein D3C86_1666350 [compost metagenome]